MSTPTPASQPSLLGRAARRPDAAAVLLLLALWGLYFWRLFTPAPQDALSLTEGDFSGQFVAFFGYQTARLSHGEVPLWDPYQSGGFPFLADTQSAVFYPPRLLTAAAVAWNGAPSPGELYAALQSEMALHVLLATLLMYALVRTLTAPAPGAPRLPSLIGGLVAAVTWGYGGYLSGYPQLQVAVLEAGVWLPLILLGLWQAARGPRLRWGWIVVAGIALGLSLLAGHPQTSLFALYFALAFLAYRLWPRGETRPRAALRAWMLAAALFGLVGGGLAAVQLLPGLEYLQHTTRGALSVSDKGNGFPFMDLGQVLFPGFISLWSPLYSGIAGLILAALAVWRRAPASRFFAAAALIALGLSFGLGTVIYDLAYLLVPGIRWFRGQERAAYLVALSLSILAGCGTAALLSGALASLETRRFARALWILAGLCGLVAAVFFVIWRTPEGSAVEAALRSTSFAALLAVVAALVLPWVASAPGRIAGALAVLGLVVFDLFSVTMGAANYDPVPAAERLPEPAIIPTLRAELPPGARVDGLRGVRDNYGSLYKVADIRTISPLKLRAIEELFDLPAGRAWDLLAVRYVLTDWNELPVPSRIVTDNKDPLGAYHVHLLDNPRPFALPVYAVTVVAGDAEAWGLLREPSYDTRQAVILEQPLGVELPGTPPADPGTADVVRFEPERIVIRARTAAPAVLTLALPHYPGWQARLDGRRVPLLRAYGSLSAVVLPSAGEATLDLRYRPRSFTWGAAISGLTVLALVVGAALAALRRVRARRGGARR